MKLPFFLVVFHRRNTKQFLDRNIDLVVANISSLIDSFAKVFLFLSDHADIQNTVAPYLGVTLILRGNFDKNV